MLLLYNSKIENRVHESQSRVGLIAVDRQTSTACIVDVSSRSLAYSYVTADSLFAKLNRIAVARIALLCTLVVFRCCGSMEVPRPSRALRSPVRHPVSTAESSATPDMGPQTITIVSYGAEAESGRKFKDAVDEIGDIFVPFDARLMMPRDPNVAVKHGENGQFPCTQRAVMQQEGFGPFLTDLIDASWHHNALALFCNAGMHRSDVAGRVLEDVLNGIVDKKGRRLYNAKYFSVSAVPAKMMMTVIKDAKQWFLEPWALMPMSPPELEKRFGYEAAMTCKTAWDNFNLIHAHARSEYEDFDAVEHIELLKMQASMPPSDVAPWKLEPAETAPAVEPEIVEVHPEPTTEEPAAKRPRPPNYEPWETVSRNITVWGSVLEENGVDVNAKQELYLLAQLGEDGYRAANGIIAKLIKKRCEGNPVRKPSAFVHQCTLNARNAMENGWGPVKMPHDS